jgi:hypothetical protein
MEGKVYVGSGKEKKFENGGSIINVLLDVDDLAAHFKEFGFTTQQGKRKIRVNVTERKEADQWGNTHSVSIDTFKPKPKDDSLDSIPF